MSQYHLTIRCVAVLACFTVIAGGCGLFSHKKTAPAVIAEIPKSKVLFADSFNTGELENCQAFILSDSANIYIMDSADNLTKTGYLYMNDSVQVRNFMLMPFMNMYYSFQWHGRKAYVYGPDLGYKNTDVDFDGDGEPDQVLCGYTDYDTSSAADVISQHPMWIRFISATGQRYELHDSGYSEISFEPQTDSNILQFSKPTAVLDINAGYPACGYPQYHILVAFRDGKLEIMHKHITNMDSGYGNYFEEVLPSVKSNHTDTVFLIEHLSTQPEDNTDTIVSLSWDSSIIYRRADKWVTNTFWKSPSDTLGN